MVIFIKSSWSKHSTIIILGHQLVCWIQRGWRKFSKLTSSFANESWLSTCFMIWLLIYCLLKPGKGILESIAWSHTLQSVVFNLLWISTNGNNRAQLFASLASNTDPSFFPLLLGYHKNKRIVLSHFCPTFLKSICL